MSGVITAPQWLSLLPMLKGNATLLGFVVAFYDIGCLLGALCIMSIGDKIGRKKSCLLDGFSVIIGVTIQVTTFDHNGYRAALAQFMIGRVLTGFGNGVNMASMPVLQAEVREAKHQPHLELTTADGGIIREELTQVLPTAFILCSWHARLSRMRSNRHGNDVVILAQLWRASILKLDYLEVPDRKCFQECYAPRSCIDGNESIGIPDRLVPFLRHWNVLFTQVASLVVQMGPDR